MGMRPEFAWDRRERKGDVMRTHWMRSSFVVLLIAGPCDDFGLGPCEEESVGPESAVIGTVRIDNVEAPGVTVTLDGTGVTRSMETDPFGKYNFSLSGLVTLPKVRVTPPAGVFFDPEERDVTSAADGAVNVIDFDGYRGAKITGRVTVAGVVAEDVNVTIRTDGSNLPRNRIWDFRRRTDASGDFSFDYWPALAYELQVGDPTDGAAFAQPAPFTLTGGEDRHFDITGQLFVHGIVEAGGVRVAGVMVTSTGPGGTFTTVTGSDGLYRIQSAQIVPGLYTISISGFDTRLYRFPITSDTATLARRPYRNLVIFTGQLVTPNSPPVVTIASPASNATFPVATPITFQGSATDPEDGVLSGAALVWSSSLGGQFGTGTSVTTSSLPAGTHTITLTATDSDGGSGSNSIPITTTAPSQPGSISGRVTGNGFAVGGATLTLSGAASATTTTDGNGNYSFPGLAPGTYTVTVSVPFSITFPAPSQTVTLAPGQNRTVNFPGTYGSEQD